MLAGRISFLSLVTDPHFYAYFSSICLLSALHVALFLLFLIMFYLSYLSIFSMHFGASALSFSFPEHLIDCLRYLCWAWWSCLWWHCKLYHLFSLMSNSNSSLPTSSLTSSSSLSTLLTGLHQNFHLFSPFLFPSSPSNYFLPLFQMVLFHQQNEFQAYFEKYFSFSINFCF